MAVIDDSDRQPEERADIAEVLAARGAELDHLADECDAAARDHTRHAAELRHRADALRERALEYRGLSRFAEDRIELVGVRKPEPFVTPVTYAGPPPSIDRDWFQQDPVDPSTFRLHRHDPASDRWVRIKTHEEGL